MPPQALGNYNLYSTTFLHLIEKNSRLIEKLIDSLEIAFSCSPTYSFKPLSSAA